MKQDKEKKKNKRMFFDVTQTIHIQLLRKIISSSRLFLLTKPTINIIIKFRITMIKLIKGKRWKFFFLYLKRMQSLRMQS